MKIIIRFILITALFANCQMASAQADVLGHLGAAGQFLGWNGATATPLEIRHNNNRQIRLFTNNFQRMVIDNGAGLAGAGRIAMGNNLAIGFTPQSRLHLHQTLGIVDFRLTNAATGADSIHEFNY